MSRSRPNLLELETWTSWERFCLGCLALALEELRRLPDLPEGENALNGKLHECLRKAARQVRPNGPYSPVGYECPPQPYGESEESARRLKPCPDFVWGFVDHQEPDVLRNAREFVIECKRLRQASRSWKYNESYVEDGIRRFVDPQKKYGIGVSSGVMVGYQQSTEAEAILQEVNDTAARCKLPALSLSKAGWKPGGTSHLQHSLDRAFPHSRFTLEHLWVDVRVPHSAQGAL
jgi:hypothetical protein